MAQRFLNACPLLVPKVALGVRYAHAMSVDHYENFPVASLLLPKRLRAPVAAVYAFARHADDIADEGHASSGERLAALSGYGDQLDRIASGQHPDVLDQAMFERLADVIAQHALPIAPLRDLLSAFSQDVVTTRYDDFDSLMDYCRRSANPVGRIMLALYGVPFGKSEVLRLQQSDSICSALQLINFWQDVGVDLGKGRIYLPQGDLQRFGVSERMLADGVTDERWRALMAFQVERSRSMMWRGAPLALALPGRIGFELRLVVQGGLRILEKIEEAGYDVFRHRPVLGPGDWLLLFGRSIRMRSRTIVA